MTHDQTPEKLQEAHQATDEAFRHASRLRTSVQAMRAHDLEMPRRQRQALNRIVRTLKHMDREIVAQLKKSETRRSHEH